MKLLKTERIAITLPGSLLAQLEGLRKTTGDSRSGLVQKAIKKLLADIEKEAMIKAYVKGYEKYPETSEEIEGAIAAAAYIPWD